MKKGILAAFLVVLLILSTSSFSVVSAMAPPPGFEKAGERVPEQARNAIENLAPDIDLPDIDAVTFIFYVGKPGWTPGKGPGGAKGDKGGYKLLRGGVKWADEDLPVKYSINATGYEGGFDAVVAAFETWDAEVAKELFDDNNVGTAKAEESGENRNNINTVSWENLKDNGIIAQCTIWFYVNTKRIVEFDIVFNTQHTWGIDDNVEDNVFIDAFDIQNIATHESGHTLHLGDLYEDKYSEMTMYGYAEENEVKKRSLEWGDINGVHKLYGA